MPFSVCPRDVIRVQRLHTVEEGTSDSGYRQIGTWETNASKALGQLVKVGPTFDQLLFKYVKKMAEPINRTAKQLHSPPHERQVAPIESPKNNVQLIPNIPAWTPPPPYPPMMYQYTYLLPPYVPNQMWGMPPYTYGMPQYSTRGHPKLPYLIGWCHQCKTN
jgi:hypothetical protein